MTKLQISEELALINSKLDDIATTSAENLEKSVAFRNAGEEDAFRDAVKLILTNVRNGRKIAAINAYRGLTGSPLRKSKDFIDGLMD